LTVILGVFSIILTIIIGIFVGVPYVVRRELRRFWLEDEE